MVKQYLYLFVLLMVVFLAACGPSNVEQEPTESAPDSAPAGEDVLPRATITGTAAPAEAYPARPTLAPLPEGYVQPEALPTVNAYPAAEGQTWITIPAGVQCEEPLLYPTQEDAVASLETAGITVHEARTVQLPVITLCGSPTGLQYLVLIDSANLGQAEQMGWVNAE
jgi:hypothetical protein